MTGSSPFQGPPVEEVQLVRGPLLSTIAQVRYPKRAGADVRAQGVAIARRLGQTYPIQVDEQALEVVVGPGSSAQPPAQQILRLRSTTDKWQVSVGETFVSLDTSSYRTREDFCRRFDEVVSATSEVIAPLRLDRVGMRYHNRFTGGALDRIDSLVYERVLWLSPGSIAPAALVQTLAQAQMRLDDVDMTVRTGLLPSNVVFDPTIPALDEQSWLLDVDVYQTTDVDFEPAAISARIRAYADLAYRLFRWATTADMLRYYEASNDT